MTIDATARYYGGLELPGNIVKFGVKEAGGLLAIYDNPDLATDRASTALIRPT